VQPNYVKGINMQSECWWVVDNLVAVVNSAPDRAEALLQIMVEVLRRVNLPNEKVASILDQLQNEQK
jgi:hypothetical protein